MLPGHRDLPNSTSRPPPRPPPHQPPNDQGSGGRGGGGQGYRVFRALRQVSWSRVTPGLSISANRTIPALSITKVPRFANPRSALNTPYAWATSPCGQKSASSGKSKCSRSAQILWAYEESTLTV